MLRLYEDFSYGRGQRIEAKMALELGIQVVEKTITTEEPWNLLCDYLFVGSVFVGG